MVNRVDEGLTREKALRRMLGKDGASECHTLKKAKEKREEIKGVLFAQ